MSLGKAHGASLGDRTSTWKHAAEHLFDGAKLGTTDVDEVLLDARVVDSHVAEVRGLGISHCVEVVNREGLGGDSGIADEAGDVLSS